MRPRQERCQQSPSRLFCPPGDRGGFRLLPPVCFICTLELEKRRTAMTDTAKVLRSVAFTFTALFGLLGGMFVAGAAFDDPGGWPAVAMTALCVLPLIALSVFALRRPAAAGPVFVGATALICSVHPGRLRPRHHPTRRLGARRRDRRLRDRCGAGVPRPAPRRARRPADGGCRAGSARGHGDRRGPTCDRRRSGPGPGAMLGGSSGVVILPILVVGLLFLLAGSLGHESLRPGSAHAS